jgi:tetratricopeptide (TPR) repeat protein/transcriptional regulator with XRE-family HTH domain
MTETKPIPNHTLRDERTRRDWSQQDLADKVGTTPNNVGRWERGETVPGPYFRQQLCEVFGKSSLELGLIEEQLVYPSLQQQQSASLVEAFSSNGPGLPVWNVPYGRNSFFTGREEALERLRAALTIHTHPIAITQPQAISGLGGIGKTQLAIEYAYRYRANYTTVLWVRAESVDLLISDFLTISVLLGLPEHNEQDQSKIVNAVLRWLDTHTGWLLILDNADHLETSRAFIPSSGHGHVLLTTRAFSTGTIAGRIELETMTVEEGMRFLLRRIKSTWTNTALEGISESVWSLTRAIVEAMDGLPLALDQAGAYIEETRSSLRDYLKLYQARRQRLLRMRGQDAAGHPEPVATTWSLSLEKIKQANPAAAELLCLLALLHPDSIPEAMIAAAAAELGPVLQPVVEEELDFNETIGELHKYSLIKRDPEKKILVIHRLVQAVIWDNMESETQRQWAERTVRSISRVFPDVEFATWDACQQFLPHAQTCVTLIDQWQMEFLEAVQLLHRMGKYLQARAQYAEGEPIYQKALALHERLLGPDHPKIAQTLSGLASLYREQGKYAQAEPLYQRALTICEQAQGTSHVEVANILNELALLYEAQGKYEQGEPLYRRALLIFEQALGQDHPHVATSLNGLALLYRDQGKYEEGEPLYRRALRIREKALGQEHPDVATTLNGLAQLYRDQGKNEQAEPLYRRALDIREQALGQDHPNVAIVLNNLAELYLNQGKYAQAEPLLQRASQIFEQGPNYLVAYPLNNLAELYLNQGKYEQAEPLYQRVLRIFEQVIGPEHPLVAYPLNGLANIYREQGKYEQAAPLYQHALTIRERQLGEQHLETAESLHDFARFHEIRLQPEEAIALYLQALTIREQQLGLQHQLSVDTRSRAAQLLRESGRTEEAATLEAASEQKVMTSDHSGL